jgi:hypothetical protein
MQQENITPKLFEGKDKIWMKGVIKGKELFDP